MNTQIQDIEEELRELAEATEQAANKLAELRKPKRTPEAGDVWIALFGRTVVVDDQGGYTYTNNGYRVSSVSISRDAFSTYLGKFDEVYMLRSEADDRLQVFKDQITGWDDYDGQTIFDSGVDLWEFFDFVKSITLSR